MPKISPTAGSTSQVMTFFIPDTSSTTGAGLTGLTNATSGLTCYYKRNRDSASVAVSLVTITTLGTYVSGGFKAVDGTNMPGLYEFHPPNAAFVSGSQSVVFYFKGATNMAPIPFELEITVVDNQNQAFNLSIAKTTNVTGFNDIAATSIVTGGAITTGSGIVAAVASVGTLTTYTGNTPQTGDAFARIGANGAGLTGVGLNLGQTGLTVRDLGGVADSALTLSDGFVAAIAGAVGKASTSGTSYIVKTPFTGTIVRTFALDVAAPNSTSRT